MAEQTLWQQVEEVYAQFESDPPTNDEVAALAASLAFAVQKLPGCSNYWTASFDHVDRTPTVTVQLVDGMTPREHIQELQEQRDALLEACKEALAVTQTTQRILSGQGYPMTLANLRGVTEKLRAAIASAEQVQP